jgi:ligand-binding sensor domain-containing protein
MNSKKIFKISILNFLLIITVLPAQDIPIKFDHISIEQGLSHSCVPAILQDSKGFLWFGTENGLNKYDGYGYEVYWHQPDNSASISHNFIRVIYEDRDGNLWIGTDGGGLNKFDRKTETFTRYQHDPQNPTSLSNNYVFSICEDQSGTLWIGTNGGGVNKLDRASGQFKRYLNDPDDSSSLSNNEVYAICEDYEGTLWLGTYGGLNKYDRETGRFIHYVSRRGDPNSISSNSIWSLCEDHTGKLWIGTYQNGLNRFDPQTEKFNRYFNNPNDPHSISNNQIWTIYEDRQGNLWIGTLGGGINQLNRKRDRFISYQLELNNPYSLSDINIASIYQDRSGTLWIGTFGGGINALHRKKNRFHLYRSDPYDATSLSSSYVSCFWEDQKGVFWIGTSGGGLNRFDKKTGSFKRYRAEAGNPNRLQNDFINSIIEDRSGNLWVATQSGGFHRFDKRTDSFINCNIDPRNPNSLVFNHVHTLLEDHTGTIWIGTFLGGLYRYRPRDGTLKRFPYEADNPRSMSSDFISTIYEDRSEVLWIGTRDGGLNKLKPLTESFVRYQFDRDDSSSLSHNEITTIFEDRKGFLWIGTRWGGLNRLDKEKDNFERFQYQAQNPYSISLGAIMIIYEDRAGALWIGTDGGGLNRLFSVPDSITRESDSQRVAFYHYRQKDGLSSDFIRGILEDDHGNIWVSSTRGISKIYPGTGRIKNFDVSNGLQGNEFYFGSLLKSRNGEMFFGGRNGFNSFHPDSISENSYIPPIVVTDFKLFNRSIRSSGKSVLSQHISETKELVLSYQQNVFSFEFAALNFINSQKNQYMYQMVGFDENWIYAGSRRFASYTNLDPGEYNFKVKGSNDDGIWNEAGIAVRIKITPPFWATWWFRILTLLLIVGVIYIWYRFRLKNVRLRTELQAARDAQMSIMPQSDPQIEGLDVSGECIPANEVGGDFFDYIWSDEGKKNLVIAVGDVSGKAMKAAMTAVMASGMINTETREGHSIQEIMTRVNRPLYIKTDKQMFTALCLTAIDVAKKELTFVNAGLVEPILISGDAIHNFRATGPSFPLGMLENSIYQEQKVPLREGDIAIFLTDGILEAQNHSKEFYGEERLKSVLEKVTSSKVTAGEIKEKIIEDVRQFAGTATQFDDMTIVVVRIT